VAPKEYDAIQAAAQLKVVFKDDALLPGDGNIVKQMRAQDAAGMTVNTAVNQGNVDTALASSAKMISSSYSYGYNSHAPMGPTCCVADVTADGAVIYTNGQDSYVARPRVAAVLGLPVNKVRLIYFE